jgi:hypothetical protein
MNINKIKRECLEMGLKVTARHGLIYLTDNTLNRGFTCKTFLTINETKQFIEGLK